MAIVKFVPFWACYLAAMLASGLDWHIWRYWVLLGALMALQIYTRIHARVLDNG